VVQSHRTTAMDYSLTMIASVQLTAHFFGATVH
jgi:hypothetical protein